MTIKNDTDELIAKDQKNILHPATSIVQLMEKGATIIEEGKGIHLQDSRGHKTIDGIAGLWCVNAGYGRAELGQAMADAASKLGYYHSFGAMSNRPQIELAERLVDMAPGRIGKVFFGSSGSDANDSLVKIVWHYNNILGRPEKRKIISRFNAYHGTGVASASLTGIPAFHKMFNLPIDGIIHTTNPHYYRYGHAGESEEAFSARRAAELEKMIQDEGPDTVAAFIAEPIMGAGGVIDPPKGYFAAIKAVLKKYDILFIADEVICGYGRLGSNFGSTLMDLDPDMMASAKGLTSGYFPMSAAFITDEIWEVLKKGSEQLGSFAHGYTYSGHPVGAACALANLDIMDREGLVENAADVGAYLHQKLHDTFDGHKHIAEVRGKGLLAAVQLIADKDNKKFFDAKLGLPFKIGAACYEKGLIVRALPSVTSIALSPPLIVNRADVDEIVARLEAGINAGLGELADEDFVGVDP